MRQEGKSAPSYRAPPARAGRAPDRIVAEVKIEQALGHAAHGILDGPCCQLIAAEVERGEVGQQLGLQNSSDCSKACVREHVVREVHAQQVAERRLRLDRIGEQHSCSVLQALVTHVELAVGNVAHKLHGLAHLRRGEGSSVNREGAELLRAGAHHLALVMLGERVVSVLVLLQQARVSHSSKLRLLQDEVGARVDGYWLRRRAKRWQLAV